MENPRTLPPDLSERSNDEESHHGPMCNSCIEGLHEFIRTESEEKCGDYSNRSNGVDDGCPLRRFEGEEEREEKGREKEPPADSDFYVIGKYIHCKYRNAKNNENGWGESNLFCFGISLPPFHKEEKENESRKKVEEENDEERHKMNM